jgi:hypothetical protein
MSTLAFAHFTEAPATPRTGQWLGHEKARLECEKEPSKDAAFHATHFFLNCRVARFID